MRIKSPSAQQPAAPAKGFASRKDYTLKKCTIQYDSGDARITVHCINDTIVRVQYFLSRLDYNGYKLEINADFEEVGGKYTVNGYTQLFTMDPASWEALVANDAHKMKDLALSVLPGPVASGIDWTIMAAQTLGNLVSMMMITLALKLCEGVTYVGSSNPIMKGGGTLACTYLASLLAGQPWAVAERVLRRVAKLFGLEPELDAIEGAWDALLSVPGDLLDDTYQAAKDLFGF